MAVAVIGGLITSTALTLVLVPVVFSYVRDFEEWLARRGRRPADVSLPVAAPLASSST